MPQLTVTQRPSVDQDLIQIASRAMRSATPNITAFQVGAAVRAEDGNIYEGSNAEIVTGHFEHAERSALSAGRQAGHRRFTAVAVAATGPTLITPCGACRDWLNQHLPAEAPVYCFHARNGEVATYTVGELLPHAPRLEALARDVDALS